MINRKLTFPNIRDNEDNIYTVIADIRLDVDNVAKRKSWLNLKQLNKYYTLAISWEIWRNGLCEHSGQAQDEVRNLLIGENKTIQFLLDMHRKYHLNDCTPGTKKQIEFLEKNHLTELDYKEKVNVLNKAGLNKDYEYGSGWLVKEIPQKELDKIFTCISLTTEYDKPEYKKILKYITKELDDDEKLKIWNNWYCEHDPCYLQIYDNDLNFYEMYFPNLYFGNKSYYDNFILNSIKNYNENDKYVYLTETNYIVTFDNIYSKDSPYKDEYLANIIFDYPQYFSEIINDINEND